MFALTFGDRDHRSLRDLGYPAARAAESHQPLTAQQVADLHAFAAALQLAITAVEQALSATASNQSPEPPVGCDPVHRHNPGAQRPDQPDHTTTATPNDWTATAKDYEDRYGLVIFAGDAATFDDMHQQLTTYFGECGASLTQTWTEVSDNLRRYGYDIFRDTQQIATAVIEGDKDADHP
ncbi:hypothetical protein [Nocardia sp. GP40]|uniref:hypothetical protein n=1 Tax=Nocardia sp. GP40 TaxID=3156268 RepID=UPI003D1D6169